MKMTLSEDLASPLGDGVEQVATSMGMDVALSIISSLGPSITVITTSLFSSENFRDTLHHWCKSSKGRIRIIGKKNGETLNLVLEERTANNMAPEIAEVVTKFIADSPNEPAMPALPKP